MRMTYRERDDALAIAQPALPFFFFDCDTTDTYDLRGSERVRVREHDFDRHGLLVDDVRDVDFLAAHADLDGPLLVLGVLRDALLVPLSDALQTARDDERRDVLRRPGLDGQRGLAAADVEVVGLDEAGEVGEGEVEEVGEEVLDVALGVVFEVGLVGLDVEFGGVDGFAAGVAEEVEAEVEEAGEVGAVFELVDVVALDFVAGIGEVVEEEAPAVEVALEAQGHGAVEGGVGECVEGGRFQDE